MTDQITASPKKGRGKAKATLDLIDAAAAILREIQPATVRAVCYQLFITGFIDKMTKNNTDKVSKQLVWAREHDVIPWAHIVDETRKAERVASWNNPDEIIRVAVNSYRRNYWQDQPERLEVWSEKGTVRGTLAPILDEYGLTFRVMHGFGSATSLHDIADETQDNDKPLTIIYVGDRDPSGNYMSEVDIPRRLELYGGQASFVRVAITDEDIGPDTSLPSFDASTKKADPRHRWYVERYGSRCWELDALSPVLLRERVDAEILNHLDVDAWNHAIDVEAAETGSMKSFLAQWQSISRQAGK